MSTRRRIALAAAVLLALIVFAAGGSLIWALHANLAPLAGRLASARLHRNVGVGELRLGWNDGVTVLLRDLRVDNLEGGSGPVMVGLRELDAVVDARSILSGPLVVRTASVDGLTVLLEHAAGGAANWKFSPVEARPPPPPDLAGFPAVLDAAVHDFALTFRTSSGALLDAKAAAFTMHTAAPDQPISLVADGSYNGTPMHLEGTLQSFDRLRLVPQPFGASVQIKSGDAVAEFKGSMTDPLNFDGVTGPIYLNVPFLSDLQDALGFSIEANLPVALAGTLTKKGDDWDLPDGNGLIDEDAFTLSGHLKEGGRGVPDDVKVSAVFDRLDLNLLTDAGAKRPKGTRAPRTMRSASIPLYVDEKPGTLVDAAVDVKQLIYYRFSASDVALHVKVVPKKVSVEYLSLLYAGTRAVVSGAAEQKGPVAQVELTANLSDGDLRTVLRSLGVSPVPIGGGFSAQAASTMTGDDLVRAMRGARTTALVTMTSGSLDTNIVEMISLNARRLFRKPTGAAGISCMLGVVDMNGLAGRLRPLRIRTSDGTLAGVGSFDLQKNWVDLTVGSLSSTTDFFALDIPIHVSGPLDNPSVSAAGKSAARDHLFGGDELGGLPPAQQAAARANRCLAGR
nr:AsmA-like C-terminal region-containing protein [uncultured Rhodopila sp.]